MSTATILNPQLDSWPRDVSKVSFGRHETFHIRDGWLIKGMEAVDEHPDLFNRQDAIDILGVGRNMVSSIRHWLLVTGLVVENHRPGQPRGKGLTFGLTPLAELIRDRDPYFEEDASLWIVHLNLATNYSRATTWFWAFNCLGQGEFQRDAFLVQFQRYLTQQGLDALQKPLERDFACFIRTYAPSTKTGGMPTEDSLDCPLANLQLVDRLGRGNLFRFSVGPKASLPHGIVSYAIYRFAENTRARSRLLPFDAVRWGEGSPGRLLCLDNETLYSVLEQIESDSSRSLIRLTRTAGLVQIHLSDLTSDEVLREAYDAS